MSFFGFGTLIVNLFLMGYMFTKFKCGRNILFQIFTIIGVLGMYALAALKTRLRIRQDSSIITSGVASLYVLYMQWSALSADVDGTCNTVKGAAVNDSLQITFGICFTVACLFIISASRPRSEMTDKEKKEADADGTAPEAAPKLDEEGKPMIEGKDTRTEQEAMADANAAVYGKNNIGKTTEQDEDLADMKKYEQDHFPISDVSIQF